MDHIEVLMRLVNHEGSPLTGDEVVRETRLGAREVGLALDDLVTSGLAALDSATGTYRYAPRGAEDRAAVESLAALYHQRPVTLVKLVYEQPPAPVKSFAEAFRLRSPASDK
jgi:DNA-binding IclR family transcriptional regulator